jgi:hypothetical protein
MKSIRIEPHTLKRAAERGADQDEIIETLKNGFDVLAKHDRLSKEKVFPFNTVRNNKYYEEKKIQVIYTIENNEIVTITVYVFYGKWV